MDVAKGYVEITSHSTGLPLRPAAHRRTLGTGNIGGATQYWDDARPDPDVWPEPRGGIASYFNRGRNTSAARTSGRAASRRFHGDPEQVHLLPILPAHSDRSVCGWAARRVKMARMQRHAAHTSSTNNEGDVARKSAPLPEPFRVRSPGRPHLAWRQPAGTTPAARRTMAVSTHSRTSLRD